MHIAICLLQGFPRNKETLPMAETVVPAKPEQRIWVLSGEWNNPFSVIDVIAWVVPSSGHPIPVTVMGRLDKDAEYVLGTGNGWIVLPGGQTFTDSPAVSEWLRSRRAS
jgi:hypothetical protein